MFDVNFGSIMILVFLILIFLAIRDFYLWYFKINESIKLQKEIVRLLTLISTQTSSNKVETKVEPEIEPEVDIIKYVFIKTKDNKILEIKTINNKYTGAKVFMDNEIAPDGKYEDSNSNRIIFVKNGEIIV